MGATRVDFLVVGYGIAGALVAESLHRRGYSVRVIDRHQDESASLAAAALITPVAGKRFALRRDLDRLRPAAVARYVALESQLGMPLLQTLTLFRAFEDPSERSLWEAKRDHPDLARFVGSFQESPPPEVPVRAPFGGVPIRDVLRVDVRTLLNGLRDILGAEAFVDGHWTAEDCRISEGGVAWEGLSARTVICCEGAAVIRNPWFSHIPWQPARGEALVADIPGFPTGWSADRGVTATPVGGGRFHVGSTYDREQLTGGSTPEGRARLEHRLDRLLTCPYEVRSYHAGVRPVTRRRLPVAGRHPVLIPVAILNGLGSTGVLRAPHYADYLAECLVGNRVPENDVDPVSHWREESTAT